MIVTFEPEVFSSHVAAVIRLAERYEGVTAKKYEFRGAATTITEVHLIGSTATVPTGVFEGLPGGQVPPYRPSPGHGDSRVRVQRRDEIMYRRIGRNELTVIDVAAAFADAQHEYAAKSHDGVPKGAYAQRFLSDPGKENGLYWTQATPKSPLSPMGDLAAKAASQGYGQSKADPYWGYYFKMLTAQGTNAPGGAKSWIDGDAMSGGFGMVAWPADYGASGIMTFMVGPDGAVRQKDLGQETNTLVAAMTTFDPDTSWTRQ